jgi:hypothetical protein
MDSFRSLSSDDAGIGRVLPSGAQPSRHGVPRLIDITFFPNDTALGLIDRSWLNDFLLGPGTVACFFVAFTLLYAAGGLLHQESADLFISNRSYGNDSSWSDHRRLIKIILWGLLARALIEAWCEEVGVFASRSVFDPWDLTIELGGIIFGAWLVRSFLTRSFPKRRTSRPASLLSQG